MYLLINDRTYTHHPYSQVPISMHTSFRCLHSCTLWVRITCIQLALVINMGKLMSLWISTTLPIKVGPLFVSGTCLIWDPGHVFGIICHLLVGVYHQVLCQTNHDHDWSSFEKLGMSFNTAKANDADSLNKRRRRDTKEVLTLSSTSLDEANPF